jgi:hypothetical protein
MFGLSAEAPHCSRASPVVWAVYAQYPNTDATRESLALPWDEAAARQIVDYVN